MFQTLNAIVRFKCPKCHEGNLFKYSNPYNLNKVTEMPETCSCCGQKTEPEPGFYYGAMFCSYILCVGIFLVNFIIFGVYLDLSPIKFISLYTIQLLILMPFIFRYARVIFIYIFVRYDKNA